LVAASLLELIPEVFPPLAELAAVAGEHCSVFLAEDPQGRRELREASMLTVKQAAQYLNCSESLVYGLIAAGRLRCHRIGLGKQGGMRITKDALQQFLKAREEGGKSVPPPRRSETKPQSFTQLDGGRLLESWRRQGVLGDQQGEGNARSCE
jgi:excisionase family DNA binding protein